MQASEPLLSMVLFRLAFTQNVKSRGYKYQQALEAHSVPELHTQPEHGGDFLPALLHSPSPASVTLLASGKGEE